MSKAIEFFRQFAAKVKETKHWQTMVQTVEDSPWHREANTAVHTEMVIEHYIENVSMFRTERQQLITLISLLFHDFGKPEAEEVLERKDGSGVYRRYAGHERVSANEMISFMCEHPGITQLFFDQGFSWHDVRRIKIIIEHHLPFGMTNKSKRESLRTMLAYSLGSDEQCFYDQLWSDCCGRISDDHETKKADVVRWIDEFKTVRVLDWTIPAHGKTMYVLVGPVGAGKSTWVQNFKASYSGAVDVISEDQYRMDCYDLNLPPKERALWRDSDPKQAYKEAWEYCSITNPKEYDAYVRDRLTNTLAAGNTLILDRTNQTRKNRGSWITAAKSKGYRIEVVEFYISENLSNERQKTRADKFVPPSSVHKIYVNIETPWLGVEAHVMTEIIAQW